MTMPLDDAEMIEELYDERDNLGDYDINEWEINFMDTMFIKFEEDPGFIILTDKQVDKLLGIYQKVFA